MTTEHTHNVRRLSEQLGYPLSVAQIEANINSVANSEHSIAFVALYNHKIVGWMYSFRALLIESKPFIEIGGLIVDENYRNNGIGRKLVEKIKEWAIENAINELTVRSNIPRAEAHKFYLNNGFTEIKQQKVFQMHL